MNWKEFKEKVEKEGVTDDMEIGYIDIDSSSYLEVSFYKNEVRSSFSIL